MIEGEAWWGSEFGSGTGFGSRSGSVSGVKYYLPTEVHRTERAFPENSVNMILVDLY